MMLLPVRLSANLAIRLLARQPHFSIVRCLSTSPACFESETSKLIRLRREREAREEQTTGFDKMVQLNELHLQIMRRSETPEVRQKRNRAIFKMAGMIMSFIVGVSVVTLGVYYLWFQFLGKDLLKLPVSHYVEFITFKDRPSRYLKEQDVDRVEERK